MKPLPLAILSAVAGYALAVLFPPTGQTGRYTMVGAGNDRLGSLLDTQTGEVWNIGLPDSTHSQRYWKLDFSAPK